MKEFVSVRGWFVPLNKPDSEHAPLTIRRIYLKNKNHVLKLVLKLNPKTVFAKLYI